MVTASPLRKKATYFIILIGVLSFFADLTYEGARSINGPFLNVLGASAFVVAVVAGLGEFVGYALRLLSGYLSDRTGHYWLFMYLGYGFNLLSLPLLAFVGYWQIAVILMILERAGKAFRNPTRDAMLSHASKETGRGWGFGLHEFMDQLGATLGPLLVSAVLFMKEGNYHFAYLLLFIPAVCALAILVSARYKFPHPEMLELKTVSLKKTTGYPAAFFIYALAAMCMATGYADFPLIAYHFKQAQVMGDTWIPVLYAIAMLSESLIALIMGHLFDKIGVWTLMLTTAAGMFFAPMVFLMDKKSAAIIGMILWGIGMGAQESVLKATVADLIPAEKRATAYGLFGTMYGVAWLAGSIFIGYLYDTSLMKVVTFCMNMQSIALIILFFYIWAAKKVK